MAKISDIIEQFIKELLEESGENIIEIQRNELAKFFDCAPSQINYVLTTRFTLGQGYIIESRRGGGGHVQIKQLVFEEKPKLLTIINEQIGNEISKMQSERLIKSLYEKGIITLREFKIIVAAIDDNAMVSPLNIKDRIRASILKNILIVLLQ